MNSRNVEEAAELLIEIWSGRRSASMSGIEHYAEVIEEARARAWEILQGDGNEDP